MYRCLVALSLTVAGAQAQARDSATAFIDVSVIPMDRERVLTGQTVVVRGSHIVALGPADQVPVPVGAARIDGRGKFLIPGLADMHTHDYNWFPFLANGITTVRHPGGTDPMLEVRRQIASGAMLAPRIYTAGSVNWSSSPEVAVQSVVAIKAAGFDAVKLPVGGEADEVYDSILAAARRVGLKIVGHVPQKRNLEEVLRSGQWTSIEHLTGYFEYVVGLSGRWSITDAQWFDFDHQRLIDTAAWMQPSFDASQEMQTIAAVTRRAGVWNCPTLWIYDALYDGLLHLPDSAEAELQRERGIHSSAQALRATTRRLFDFELQITKALQDAGAGLLLGTDSDPFAIHRELQLLVQAGLTPYQALATGTSNVAAFLGTLDSAGTVAVGKRADLVLLDGNPLTDIRYTAGPAGVMVGGQWIPRSEIDARLEALGLQEIRDAAWRPRTAAPAVPR